MYHTIGMTGKRSFRLGIGLKVSPLIITQEPLYSLFDISLPVLGLCLSVTNQNIFWLIFFLVIGTNLNVDIKRHCLNYCAYK